MHKQLAMPHSKRRASAFTIVELLVIIVVIGILAVLVVTGYSTMSQRAITASLQADLNGGKKQIENFYAINGVYPTANNCTNTLTTEICLKVSTGNSFTYTPNNTSSPTFYSLLAIRGTTIYQAWAGSSSTGTAPTGVVTGGLVLNLDAGDATSYPGTGALITDLSSSRNHGTLINGVGYTNTNGGALVIDGVDDYVNLSSVSMLPVGTSDRTVFACVRTPTSFPAYIQHIIHWGTVGSNQAYGLVVYSGGFLGTHPWGTYPNQGTVSANTVYCLAGSYTSSTSLHKFYINGTPTGGGVTQAINTGTSQARVGSRIANNEWWGPSGHIYNVLVYNRTLSDSEITQNFNAYRSRFGI